MKIISFGPRGAERAGVISGDLVLDVGRARSGWPSTVKGVLEAGIVEDLRALLEQPTRAPEQAYLPLREVRIGPPVTDPQKIICLGLNYKDHAAEQKVEPPKSPVLFAKANTSLSGPFDDIVHPKATSALDYEVEIAFVMGRKARNVEAARALDFVAGYVVLNDLSARDAQFADGQWYRGKSMDGLCPLGPWLVTKDEIADAHNLRLTCRVNGETRQDSNTAQMIFRIPETIAFITQGITLLPGDIVSTGTPPGVGAFMKPPGYLKPGDLVEVSVEGLGIQKAKVVEERF